MFLVTLLTYGMTPKGPFKCYITQWGGGGVSFPRKKLYEGVRFNIISVTRAWVKFPEKNVK